MEELKNTLNGFHKGKSPGLDALLIEFFITYFEIIIHDLLQFVEYSILNGHVFGPFNSTFITLIPKIDKPTCFVIFTIYPFVTLHTKLFLRLLSPV